MFDTPRTAKNEEDSLCPSPPRPNTNFVSIPTSVGLSLPSSALSRHPAPALLPPLLSLPHGSMLTTFSSLASDSPQSLTLMFDENDFPSSSGSDHGFFLAAPAATTRPSSYYPLVAARNINTANVVPHGRWLQPRRSSSC
jgi:hypothetical protein